MWSKMLFYLDKSQKSKTCVYPFWLWNEVNLIFVYTNSLSLKVISDCGNRVGVWKLRCPLRLYFSMCNLIKSGCIDLSSPFLQTFCSLIFFSFFKDETQGFIIVFFSCNYWIFFIHVFSNKEIVKHITCFLLHFRS